MTVDDGFSMKLITVPTAVCLMSTGICQLGEPIETSKAKVSNKICDRVDENFSIARVYSAFWGNTCQIKGVTLIICK